jgi:hypothetical protein
MPEGIDPAVAESLVSGAIGFLLLTPGKKVLCTKRQLRECLLALAQEAYAMGFLSGQKQRFGSPAWTEIPLEPEALAKHGLRIRPVVLRSLLAAGYRSLGDLGWVSDFELRKLFYIGRKTTRQIRTAIRQLQARAMERTHPQDGGGEDRAT